jgi:hypothetical protein
VSRWTRDVDDQALRPRSRRRSYVLVTATVIEASLSCGLDERVDVA